MHLPLFSLLCADQENGHDMEIGQQTAVNQIVRVVSRVPSHGPHVTLQYILSRNI